MADENGSQVEVPTPDEIVIVPNALVQFKLREDGSAILSMVVPSGQRSYDFPLSQEGREKLGRVLLGPSVQTFGMGDLPSAAD